MTYDGYMALANDDGETIELVNAARVKAYTDNLAPTLGLRGCNDCEGLPAALGEEYTSPAEDNAPWYDPTDPATAGFYGVYPLGFAGIDDSTRSIESAELSGDGSVVVGSRFTGQDIRVNGVAFAEDEAALSAGLSWLNSALNGTEEGRCFGDRLNIFSSCPPVQVLPPDFAEPYTLEVPVTQAEMGEWTTTSGTITYEPGGGAAEPGIRFDWLRGDPEKIACREITGLIPGEQYQLRSRIDYFGDYFVRLSDSCSSYRGNLAPNPRMLGWQFSGGGVADVESDVPTGGPLGLGFRRAIATSSNASSPYVFAPTSSDDYTAVTPGNIYQASIYVRAEVGTMRLTSTIRDSGGSIIASDVIFEGGVVADGTWQRLSGIVVAPPDAATLQPVVAWDLDPGDVVPNMEFGAANLLIETPHYDVIRVNTSSDPRAEGVFGWNFNEGDDGAVTSTSVTGAVDGPVLYDSVQSETYRRHEVTTAPTSGSAGPVSGEDNTFILPDPIEAGQQWFTGAYFRSNREVTGTAYHRILDGGGVVLAEVTQPFTLLADTWTYIVGGEVAPADIEDGEEAYVWLAVGGPGGGDEIEVGDIYDSTGLLLQYGSADQSYFDSLRASADPIAYVPYTQSQGFEGSAEVEVNDAGSYFDGYTDGFKWDGAPDGSISSTDQAIDYETEAGWAGSHPTEPTVLDFIPRTDSLFLSITPTNNTMIDTELLIVNELQVRRVARPGVIAFGSGYNVVPPSDGWTHVAPSNMQVIWVHGEDIEFTSVLTRASLPSSETATYTTDDGPQRTLFGLVPGSRYRLLVNFSEGWSVDDETPTTTLDPFLALSNTDGVVATYEENVSDNTIHYWSIEFNALSTSSVLAFHPGSDLELEGFGDAQWSFDQFMVEEILETDATEPDPGRVQARTMYEVKASQGPIMSNMRRTSCGVMAEVTYSLRAGNPFKYRNPTFVGGLPTGTSVEVVDVPCSEDGLPQIINFHYDPSLEDPEVIDDTWLGGGTNLSFNARATSPTARLGGYVYRVQTVIGNNMQINNYYQVPEVTSGPIPLSGSTITVSGYFRAIDEDTLGTFEWYVFLWMDGFPSISFPSQEYEVAEVGEWYRAETTFTIPDNVPLALIETGVFAPGSAVGGFERDAMMIQYGTEATEPFDQDSPNVEWTGDVGTSALALTQVIEDISEDPDCPQPPSPPAPPEIDDSCIDSPTSYNRTVVSISEDAVPRNLSAYPVITLTAGAGPVRQARIRFWENPDNLTIDQLNPCEYDGEIIVSYLADGATLVIDGVLRQATISKPGFDDRDANHILYGPDGGPVEWPELTGGIPYLVTLELDSDEGYTDTLMTIDLVVRD